MSLDQRCQSFHEAALGTGKSKGPIKEIATLRKFLHKNQDQKFSDRSVSRLFDTIQLYNKSEAVDRDTKEGLLEDALKMPFSLFSGKQKNSMLKWLEELRGDNNKTTADVNQVTQILALIDIDNDNSMSLMDSDTGDTFDSVPMPQGTEMGKAISEAFSNEENVVSVEAVVDGEQVHKILRVIVEN